LGAALIVVALAVTACTDQQSRPGSSGTLDQLVGVHWTLHELHVGDRTIAVPATISWFDLTTSYAVSGSDGCAHFQGQAHPTTDGLTISDLGMTASACLDQSVLHQTRAAFRTVLDGRPVQVRLVGSVLTLSAGTYVLSFEDGSPRASAAKSG
jgi:heat shock protein HslJ